MSECSKTGTDLFAQKAQQGAKVGCHFVLFTMVH